MAVLPTGIGPVTGYNIERSLRFNSADTPYLSRTPASAGNRKTWTWSGWIKRSSTSQTYEGVFQAGTASSAQGLAIGDTVTANVITFYYTNNDLALRSTQVLRDVSAWYHLVVALDTTQATASNRLRIYLNGSEITTWTTDNRATAFSQNSDQSINNNIQHTIGTYSGVISSIYSFNGYITEVNFIGGSALTPSSFGQTNASTGVWEPIAYTGTYGTNGFELNFSDNSNTTAATLGKDSSGNGNNWTPNNFSVTAGAGNDSLVDSPTAYGTDTGVGGSVRGNYCTLNPLRQGSNATLSNGNLAVLGSTNSYTNNNVYSTFIPSSEKWYFEASPANTYTYTYLGVTLEDGALGLSQYPGATANSVAVELGSGLIWRNNSNQGTGGTGISAGETLMVAFEPSSGKVWMGRNGTWYNSGNPAAGTGQVATIPTTGAIGPVVSPYSSSGTISFNFGQRAFAYTAPSGFKALCTTNLPTPTIGATSTTQANKYFDVSLWTGTGVAQNITNSGSMQPDWVWTKTRSQANDHFLFDAIRGVGNYLRTNSTGAEATVAQTLTSFNSNGFSVGTDNDTNASGRTFVGWQWNAGGSNATNTSGTITSTVRANTTSGFSIVTYTGNGSSGATIGHGLGVAPSFYVVKNRGSANKDWECYHISLGNTNRIRLNVTSAADTGGTMWANTSPTSTVFSVGSDADVNASTNTYVAYCFAPVEGYSAFGSYTANNSTDGVFVYLGFRPEFLMIKRSSAAGNSWGMFDTTRSTYNATANNVWANQSYAENSTVIPNIIPIDILSNGFKLRTDSSEVNGTGTYIYAAFAETPFKYSLAR